MSRALLGIAVVAALAGTPALAADMPIKASPPAVIANWTGCYIGLNAGVMLDGDRYDLSIAGGYLQPGNGFSNPANAALLDHSYKSGATGFPGGAQVGCNLQSGPLVYGLETDFDGGVSNATTVASYGPAGPMPAGSLAGLSAASHTETVSEQLTWYSTVRARLGFTVTPTWLLYVTGGLAVGQIKSATTIQFDSDRFLLAGSGFTGSDSVTRTGWTIGGGTEWALGNNWSVRAEYLFLDFGNLTYLSGCSTLAVCGPAFLVPGQSPFAWQTHIRAEDNVFRLGVDYKFGDPIIARD